VFRAFRRRLPLLKFLALIEVAMLARRHLQRLQPAERRRLFELLRRGRRLDATERQELRALVSKLEARAFAFGAVDAFSPWPLPRRLAGRRR